MPEKTDLKSSIKKAGSGNRFDVSRAPNKFKPTQGVAAILDVPVKDKNRSTPDDYGLSASIHSTDFIKAIRPRFVKYILKALKDIQNYAQQHDATMYVDTILQNIKQMEEYIPYDPYMDILRALYDSLAYEGLWATYTAGQYEIAHNIIDDYLKYIPIPAARTEKAILALDSAGFDIVPYSFEFPDEDI